MENFENRSNQEKNILDSDFLLQQIKLPKEKWDDRFKQLVEKKIAENKSLENDETEPTREEEIENTLKRYLNGLGLDEQTLKNKKVLDLGYGEGEFVKGLIEKGTTQEAYGVDEGSREVEADNAAEGHFFQGDFEKPLPVHDVDYVVSVGAVSLGISGTEKIMNIEAILENALAALKEKGEIRIYPIQEPAIANFYAHLDESRKTWEETVHEFAKSHGAEYSFVPRDILVTGYKNDVFLNSVLTIKKK